MKFKLKKKITKSKIVSILIWNFIEQQYLYVAVLWAEGQTENVKI